MIYFINIYVYLYLTAVQIATVMYVEQRQKYVTNRQVSVCAKLDMVDQGVISVFQATMAIQIVNLVAVVKLVVLQQYVMRQENVLVSTTLQDGLVNSVVLVITNILIVCVCIQFNL